MRTSSVPSRSDRPPLSGLSAIAGFPAGAEGRLLFGVLPPGLTLETLAGLAAKDPVIRKLGERLAVAVPARGGGHTVFVFSEVLPVTELQGLVDALVALAGNEMCATAPTGAMPGESAADALLSALAGTGRVRPAPLLSMAADCIVEAGLAGKAVVLHLGADKVRRQAVSDRGLVNRSDVIRALIHGHRASEPVFLRIAANDTTPDALDAALLAQTGAAGHVTLVLPPKGDPGLGYLLFDAAVSDAAELNRVSRVIETRLPGAAGLEPGRVLRPVVLGCLVAAVIFLAAPAPRMVTVAAKARALDTQVVTLPFPVILEDLSATVGQSVTEGDVLARFDAPDLRETRASLVLERSVEELGMQAALSENDYGAFVQAESRLDVIGSRLAQIDARLARLTVTAPVSGTVISTLAEADFGRHLPVGEEIVAIQRTPRFAVDLGVPPSDARWLAAGQSGDVVFRGFSDRSFAITVETPAGARIGTGRGREELVAGAALDTPAIPALIHGLSGFARINTGSAMRASVWGRHAIEYLRTRAWMYLNLRF